MGRASFGDSPRRKLKLYKTSQELIADAFSGNIRGMGPGVAKMEFTERTAEPIVAFMMDKIEPGAFNLPIFKIFVDPFNTVGLVIDPACHHGFVFEIWDIMEHKKVFMNCPEEMYDILALIGAKSRYIIKRVYPKAGSKLPEEEPVAVISTEKLFQTAGTYVGKDDPTGTSWGRWTYSRTWPLTTPGERLWISQITCESTDHSSPIACPWRTWNTQRFPTS